MEMMSWHLALINNSYFLNLTCKIHFKNLKSHLPDPTPYEEWTITNYFSYMANLDI